MKTTVALLLATAVLGASPAMAADILFYARNGCRGPVAFRYPAKVTAGDNCKAPRKRCSGHNDEARSLYLPDGAATFRLAVYDSPDASGDDDYMEITPPAALPGGGVCISTFEPSASAPRRPWVRFHHRNGLDGKVSYIAVDSVRLR